MHRLERNAQKKMEDLDSVLNFVSILYRRGFGRPWDVITQGADVLGSLGTSLEVANGALTWCWADACVSRAPKAAQHYACSTGIALKIPL